MAVSIALAFGALSVGGGKGGGGVAGGRTVLEGAVEHATSASRGKSCFTKRSVWTRGDDFPEFS